MTSQMNKISYDTGSESWLPVKTGEKPAILWPRIGLETVNGPPIVILSYPLWNKQKELFVEILWTVPNAINWRFETGMILIPLGVIQVSRDEKMIRYHYAG